MAGLLSYQDLADGLLAHVRAVAEDLGVDEGAIIKGTSENWPAPFIQLWMRPLPNAQVVSGMPMACVAAISFAIGVPKAISAVEAIESAMPIAAKLLRVLARYRGFSANASPIAFVGETSDLCVVAVEGVAPWDPWQLTEEPPPPPPPDSSLINELLAYWTLDEETGTRTDSHGSHDLAQSGPVGTDTGIIATAAHFDGTNALVTDGADLPTGDTPWTAWCWIKAQSFDAGQVYMSKGTPVVREWWLWSNGDNRVFFTAFGPSGATTAVAGECETGQWYLLIAWHDPDDDRIWLQIDDTTPQSAVWAGGMGAGAGNLRLGVRDDGVGHFNGLIDEAGISNRILSADERTALYNAGAGTTYPFS